MGKKDALGGKARNQAAKGRVNESQAQAVGAMLARTGTSDITDAHVVICAQAAGYAVITSDPLDLKRLNPKLRVITV